MIKVNESYGIIVDDYQYIGGRIYYSKKAGREVIQKPRYYSRLTSALEDIAEREARDRMQEKDMSLLEAIETIKQVYLEVSQKLDEIQRSISKIEIK